MLYGYYTVTCYFGLVEGRYIQFETEKAYIKYMEE
mgnify:FL=1